MQIDSVEQADAAAQPPRSAGVDARRFDWRWQLGIFALALLLRALHLWGDTRSPFFSFRGIDALDYHQMALGLHNGTWPDDQPFFWAPLYPLFLGFLYGVVGQGALVLKCVQALMGAASCVLLYRIGRRMFGPPWIAVVAGLAAGLHGTLIYFDGQLLSAGFDVFLQLLALELLLGAGQQAQAGQRRGTGRWLAAGVVIALSVINRGAILLLLPWAGVWVWGVLRRGWPVGVCMPGPRASFRVTAASIGAMLLPSVVSLGLVAAHNLRVDWTASRGDMGLLPIAHNLGINFYLGNHWSLRDVNKTSHPQHFSRYDEFMQLPVDAGVTGAFAGSQYLIRQTLAEMRAHPNDWLHLMTVKFAELCHAAEIPRSGNLYAHRRYSPVLAALLWKQVIAFPGGVIIPLGVAGLVIALGQWRRHALLLASIATQAIFVLMFFVTARYRLPAMPLLILYGVSTLAAASAAWRVRAWVRLGSLILGSAVLFVWCNRGVGRGAEEHGYYEYCLLAQVRHQAGEVAEAIRWYEEGLRLNPDYAWGHLHLGRALLQEQRWRQAEEHVRRCIALEPQSPNVPYAHVALGQALAGQQRLREAVACWEQALAEDPQVPIAHAELCSALRRLGRESEAAAHCATAAENARRMSGQSPTSPSR